MPEAQKIVVTEAMIMAGKDVLYDLVTEARGDVSEIARDVYVAMRLADDCRDNR